MEESRLTAHQQRLGQIAGGLTPVILAASCCSWDTALAAVGLWLGVSWMLKGKQGRGLLFSSAATAVILLSLLWVREIWPEPKGRWIPLILLLLGCTAAQKGRRKAVQGSIILLWVTGILLGSVLISGVPKIEIRNLTSMGIQLLPGLWLLTILLLTTAPNQQAQSTIPWQLGAAAVLTAVLCQGILGREIQREENNPFYLVSRSVDLLGGMKRMESLTILGMLVGIYLWFVRLLCHLEGGKKQQWVWAILAAVLYLGITGQQGVL